MVALYKLRTNTGPFMVFEVDDGIHEPRPNWIRGNGKHVATFCGNTLFLLGRGRPERMGASSSKAKPYRELPVYGEIPERGKEMAW